MKPAPFDYVRAQRLGDALDALRSRSDAKVLAGGQSLIPLLSMRLASPGLLVDINSLPDLDHIRTGGDGVRIGALARHADVLAAEAARTTQPLLASALRYVAHGTIRNRGTTVGSLVHADAAAEMPMVLTLLGGSLDVVSSRGRRTIPAGDLYLGPLESALEHDEVAVEAFFPALAEGAGVGFDEVARRHGDYALCGVAAVVEVDDGRVSSARAGYLSVSEVPTVVDLTEFVATAALGGALSARELAAAAEYALTQLDPADDIHGTAAYRAQLVRVLTTRVVAAAHADAVARSRTRHGGGTE